MHTNAAGLKALAWKAWTVLKGATIKTILLLLLGALRRSHLRQDEETLIRMINRQQKFTFHI